MEQRPKSWEEQSLAVQGSVLATPELSLQSWGPLDFLTTPALVTGEAELSEESLFLVPCDSLFCPLPPVYYLP